jgi:dienelactone hydrolase
MRRLFLALSISILLAQEPAQSPYKPAPDDLDRIRTKMAEMKSKMSGSDPDVEIYYKAAEWMLRDPAEFYTKAYLQNTVSVLDEGMARAADGKKSWASAKGRVARAYRSRIDGSVQPYIMTVPESYDPKTPTRLDVVLHGRAATMNEVSFIVRKDKPATENYLVVEIYGRTNNAYRWAGETDVFEAIDSVRSQYSVDPNRIVLRGFSMGGAGAWHIGLHYPDKWAAAEAGAGFTETMKYAKLKDAPDYIQSTLHIYDAVDYALNAFNLPFVGYGGEIDPQLQASRNIHEQLGREGLKTDLKVLFLVGPGTAHKFHPESKKESDQFIDEAVAKGRTVPDHIRFVTYTTRYNECFWVTVDGMEKMYSRAEVDAKREAGHTTLTTRNISRITLKDAGRITIDGQELARASTLEKVDGKWKAAKDSKSEVKKHGLQGPIDDAFMDAFLAVNPTEQFQREYSKWMRADVPARNVDAITSSDMATHNIVLFGDPSNNKLIAKIAPKLPIRWSGNEIVAGGDRYPAADHTLAMIYPNPLSPGRYVVLNSGYTFHEAEFRGTNALLYPRLGDYAIIRKSDGKVVRAGLFDEHWQLK